jgi:hypothetical protein
MSDSSISDTIRRLDEIAGGRLLLGQSETMRALGVSRERLIEEIDSGRLRYVLVGSRRKFTPGDIAAYIARQSRGDASSVVGAAPPPNPPPSSDVVDFQAALGVMAARLAAERKAVLAEKREHAKRQAAWLKAQRKPAW